MLSRPVEVSSLKTLAAPSIRAEIEQRIASVRPDSTRLWGTMSVAGMLCHLTDSYEIPLGERPAQAVAIPQPRLVKWIALRSPLRWPRGLKTVPEVEQECGGSVPANVTAEQQRLLAAFARFCACDQLAQRPHPMFGPMSKDDWMRWGYLHANHHLRQFSA